MKKYDYAVVGGGSAGVRSARTAASLGKKTVLFERQYLGGTCVNVGCVPKKIYSYAAEFAELFEDAAAYGWAIPQKPVFDLGTLLKNKDTEIKRLNGIYDKMLSNSGVEVVRSNATFNEHGILEADGELYAAGKILLAPGGRPYKPSLPGIEQALVSDNIFSLNKLPKEIAIVGGGYIAVEMASIFNGWGSQVSLIYRGNSLLRKFDADIGAFLTAEMSKKGIEVLLNTQIQEINGTPGNLSIKLSEEKTLRTEQILYATGRVPETESLNLSAAGVTLHPNGKIIADEYFQTANPDIFAAGDACHFIELTPTAIKQGEIIARNLFENKTAKFDPNLVPSAVFSSPPVATVGKTEKEASAIEPVTVYYSEYKALKYSITDNSERTMMKLVVSQNTGTVLGIHMTGIYASEIIQGFAVALKMGAKKEDLDSTVGVHPSSAEEFVTMSTPRKS